MKKETFGKGLFVKNDINGNPIKIGDKVKVTRPACEFEASDPFGGTEIIKLEEESWKGELRMLLSKGLAIRIDTRNYKFPKLKGNYENQWKWELIKSQ